MTTAPALQLIDLTPITRTCGKCGAGFVGHAGTGWCRDCLEQAILASHRAEVMAEQRQARASVPRWDFARFGAPEFARLTSGATAIVAACRDWEPQAGNLVLSGSTGVGKTAGVVALAHRLFDRGATLGAKPSDRLLARGLFFCPAADLVAAQRAHPLGRGQAPSVRRALSAHVLILDELGREAADELLFRVVDARYLQRPNRPTIVTTALTMDELRGRYDDAFARRLVDPGRFVAAGGGK